MQCHSELVDSHDDKVGDGILWGAGALRIVYWEGVLCCTVCGKRVLLVENIQLPSINEVPLRYTDRTSSSFDCVDKSPVAVPTVYLPRAGHWVIVLRNRSIICSFCVDIAQITPQVIDHVQQLQVHHLTIGTTVL